MKVAYVVPRYGASIIGGAEYAARMLAERLVRHTGWEVEVFTTTATDARTWANDLPAGTTTEAGVRVHRFDSERGRDPGFDEWSTPRMVAPQAMSRDDQERWLDLQGPVCPAAVDAAVASDADVLVTYPYLYLPTIDTVRRAPERSIMHPAAHDEPPLRLPVLRDVFRKVQGLVFQTDGERRLLERVHPVAATPRILMGLGVETPEERPDQAMAREALGVGDRPFLLYLGRVDGGKGTETLARFFAAHKDRHPGPLALVFAGPIVTDPPPHPDIVVAGPVSEEVKWGALAAADLFVMPSGYEAFSLVVIEAWSVGTPVLVNARCAATREHCERSGGGLWFDGWAEFGTQVDRLVGDPVLRARLAEAGGAYAAEWFAWPRLIERYTDFLARTVPAVAG